MITLQRVVQHITMSLVTHKHSVRVYIHINQFQKEFQLDVMKECIHKHSCIPGWSSSHTLALCTWLSLTGAMTFALFFQIQCIHSSTVCTGTLFQFMQSLSTFIAVMALFIEFLVSCSQTTGILSYSREQHAVRNVCV